MSHERIICSASCAQVACVLQEITGWKMEDCYNKLQSLPLVVIESTNKDDATDMLQALHAVCPSLHCTYASDYVNSLLCVHDPRLVALCLGGRKDHGLMSGLQKYLSHHVNIFTWSSLISPSRPDDLPYLCRLPMRHHLCTPNLFNPHLLLYLVETIL